jgi:hypothetical protein
MADSKLSGLASGSVIGDADLSYWSQAGSSVKQAASAIATYLFGKLGFNSGAGTFNNLSLASGGTAKLNPSYTYGGGSAATVNNSNTGLMAGFGKNNGWTITPKISGNVKIIVSGDFTPSIVADEIIAVGKYGTPSSGAPALNDPVTGTSFGAAHGWYATSAVAGSAVSFVTVVTGLTVGSSYWFDIDCYVAAGLATVTIYNPVILVEELYG